ncbi:MAG: Mut7-C RNAse domain-containing protein [Aquificaceae bacterium]|nr:Mut7-C RNAse domain-containing protein [Aquificaceae bacterium]
MKKFLLEADLHRLAFWLRLLGQDAFLIKGAIEKKEITKHPDRVFVTTSRKLESHLKAWHVDYVLLPRGDWKLQLCLLIRHFHIEPVLKLNRCYYCNVELIAVSREQVRDKIPHMV